MKPSLAAVALGVGGLAALTAPSTVGAAPIPGFRASYRAVEETAAGVPTAQ